MNLFVSIVSASNHSKGLLTNSGNSRKEGAVKSFDQKNPLSFSLFKIR